MSYHTLEKIQNESNIEMTNFNNGMQGSWEMNDPNFLLQNQNDLLITISNFPILDPLDIFEILQLFISTWNSSIFGSSYQGSMQT